VKVNKVVAKTRKKVTKSNIQKVLIFWDWDLNNLPLLLPKIKSFFLCSGHLN
jgi:hypothetical protein